MLLNKYDYEFLENLVEHKSNMPYGSMMLESTIGKRFLVEMLFTESNDSGNKSEQTLKETNLFMKWVKFIFGGEVYTKVSDDMSTLTETVDKNGKKMVLNKVQVPTIFERIKGIAVAGGEKLKALYGKVKKYAMAHPTSTVLFVLGFLIVAVYLFVKQRSLVKQIVNYMVKIIAWPFTKFLQGLSWIINKLLTFMPKTPKVESTLINLLGANGVTFNEMKLFMETVYMLEDDKAVTDGDKLTKEDAKKVYTGVWAKIKRYGWKVPRNVILKLIAGYVNLFVKKDSKLAIDNLINNVKKYKEELSNYKKNADKVETAKLEEIWANIEKAEEDLNAARKKFIGEHKKVLIITAIVVLVIAGVAIWYFRKKRAEGGNVEESFAF